MLLAAALVLDGAVVHAHVGSPDVFYDGLAGPYGVFAAIRPPSTIPGRIQVDIRVPGGDIRAVHLTALPLSGEAARLEPLAEAARASPHDPQLFTGELWMTRVGSWQVRIDVEGARGSGQVSVPVPALPSRTPDMPRGTAAVLIGVMIALSLGLVSLIGAARREGDLEPGKLPSIERLRRARLAMGLASAGVLAILWGGHVWWTRAAAFYGERVYKPLRMSASLGPANRLTIRLDNPGWMGSSRVDDFVADHGYLMHLFAVRVPELDRLWHVHPRPLGGGRFAQDLPSLAAGRYALFADIVHATGLPETPVAEVLLPPLDGTPPTGDDAGATALPVSRAQEGQRLSPLAGGGRMRWELPQGPLRAGAPVILRFCVEGAGGDPEVALEPYMGMPGHLVVVAWDRSVFVHLHAQGSAPMAALAIAQASLGEPDPPSGPHAGHAAPTTQPISFPYGFPKAGRYRLFVQIKRNGRIETGIFDADAGP